MLHPVIVILIKDTEGTQRPKEKIKENDADLKYTVFHRYVIKFLSKLTEYQDSNKMTPGNIAIVLGPNLLWTHSEA